jgi:trk system potassium uptake protein TrkA
MFILVIGGGKVGTYLARALLAEGHEIVVVEKNPRRAEWMTNVLEVDIAIVGDGCDPLVLNQAGLARADCIVADTGDDEDNLVVCLIATKHSKARCIARVNNPKNKRIFESINPANPVTLISSTELIFEAIDNVVNVQPDSIIAKLRDSNLELIKLSVPKSCPSAGRRMSELMLPRNTIVVAIDRHNGNVIVPHGETTLEEGDDVFVMTSDENRPALRSLLCQPLLNGAAHSN